MAGTFDRAAGLGAALREPGVDRDDLATELLVRILRDQKLDARHLSLEDLRGPPPQASPASISMVYLVSAYPTEARKSADSVAEQLRRRFPGACLVSVFLPGMLLQPASAIDTIRSADKAAASFGEAVQICLERLRGANPKLDGGLIVIDSAAWRRMIPFAGESSHSCSLSG